MNNVNFAEQMVTMWPVLGVSAVIAAIGVGFCNAVAALLCDTPKPAGTLTTPDLDKARKEMKASALAFLGLVPVAFVAEWSVARFVLERTFRESTGLAFFVMLIVGGACINRLRFLFHRETSVRVTYALKTEDPRATAIRLVQFQQVLRELLLQQMVWLRYNATDLSDIRLAVDAVDGVVRLAAQWDRLASMASRTPAQETELYQARDQTRKGIVDLEAERLAEQLFNSEFRLVVWLYNPLAICAFVTIPIIVWMVLASKG